jgi:hypothetical protein
MGPEIRQQSWAGRLTSTAHADKHVDPLVEAGEDGRPVAPIAQDDGETLLRGLPVPTPSSTLTTATPGAGGRDPADDARERGVHPGHDDGRMDVPRGGRDLPRMSTASPGCHARGRRLPPGWAAGRRPSVTARHTPLRLHVIAVGGAWQPPLAYTAAAQRPPSCGHPRSAPAAPGCGASFVRPFWGSADHRRHGVPN